jgi:LacI family transcriptional regulator
MKAVRPILFLGSLSIGYNRSILRGIGEYIATRDGLSVMFPTDYEPADIRWLDRTDVRGLVLGACPPFGPAISRRIKQGLPTVDVSAESDSGLLKVISDDCAVGRMAADYLIDRGFKSVVYYGMALRYWSAMRWRGFQQQAMARGITCRHFDRPAARLASSGSFFPCLAETWIKVLEYPAAIFAGDDLLGAEIFETCRALRIRVPEQIAILSVDNDDIFGCWRSCRLSSVELNTAEISHRAMDMLTRLIARQKTPLTNVLVQPVRVVTRFSTNVFGVDDPLVAKALEMIHQRVSNGISVKQLVGMLGTSRPTLERHFGDVLARSPAVEISRVRAELARKQLLTTDRTVNDIALHAGYSSPRQMRGALQQFFGCTPREIRCTKSLSRLSKST